MSFIFKPEVHGGSHFLCFIYIREKGVCMLTVTDLLNLSTKISSKLKGMDWYLICAFRDPSAKLGYRRYETMWRDKLNDNLCYILSKDDLRNLYRDWRVSFAQAYSTSELFNLNFGVYNPIIISHDTFDIRLGYLIYTDRRVQAIIGKGPEPYDFESFGYYKANRKLRKKV